MRCETHFINNKVKLSSHNTPTPQVSRAYILGLLHDSTERKYTHRIAQKYPDFLTFVGLGVKSLGFKSWIYKEGKSRDVYILEFSKKLLINFNITSDQDKKDYIRGYFDSEGCVPLSLKGRYYIYLSQKDLKDLELLKSYLSDLGIFCGKTHNPSYKVDKDYFRFYILSKSFNDFALKIGSFHPIKSKYLRMKI